MIRLLALFFPLFLFAYNPPSARLNLFFNQAVREVRNAVLGAPPDSGFANQHFILWDYAEDAPQQQSYTDHYAELLLFLLAEQIPKVIVFPKDPSATGNEFFALSNQSITNDNSFVFWVNLFAELGITVEVLFEFDLFNNSDSYSPTYSLPDPFYFKDLPQKMNWLASIMKLIPGAISGVTIDPEGPNSGGNDGYQLVINYIDQYRFANGLPNLKSGMTFGVDAKTMTFANLCSFPVDTAYITPSGTPDVNFPANPLPTYRTAGNNVPLLNNVYLQAYEPDFILPFIQNLDPTAAADMFISALQDIPYKTSYGVITTTVPNPVGTYVDGGQFISTGLITCTTNMTPCSYSGSDFVQEIQVGAYLDYNNGSTVVPIGQVSQHPTPPDPDAKTFYLVDGANVTLTNQNFVLSQFAIDLPEGATINTLPSYPGHGNVKIGAIDSLVVYGNPGYSRSTHNFNFASGPYYALTGENFLTSELVMKWIFPATTPAIVAGINFLFSVQYNIPTGDLYFGNWSLPNFMAFVNRFTSQVSGKSPPNGIFTDAGSNPIPLPTANIGIYDYYLLMKTNTNSAQNTTPPAAPNPPPAPANPWFPDFPFP